MTCVLGVNAVHSELIANPASLEEKSLPGLQLNQIQVIGIHNSSHREPAPAMHALQESELARGGPEIAGIKTMHRPDFDYGTTVYTLKAALAEIRQWLKQNLLGIFSCDEILTPDDVRRDAATLQAAVLIRGWPGT